MKFKFTYNIGSKIALMLAMAFLFSFSIHAQEASDSISVKELEGVTVEGKNMSANVGGITVVPTKKIIDASADGYDLISRMAIPTIKVDRLSESVQTTLGGNVSLFIDGIPASTDDVRALRPREVVKVEYLNSPKDPRFGGARYVLNYILREKEWGGYTKLWEKIDLFAGIYNTTNLYSNFVYKRMRYDLYAGWDYTNFGDAYNSRRAKYTLLNNDGNPKEIIREEYTKNGFILRNQIPLTFRAIFNGDKVQVVNKVNFNYYHMPKNFTLSNLKLIDASDIQEGELLYDSYSIVRNFGWNGSVNCVLPKDFSFNVDGTIKYNRNNGHYEYESNFLETSSLINNNKESVFQTQWSLTAQKKIGSSIFLGLEYTFLLRDGKVDYWGSFPDTDKQTYSLNAPVLSFRKEWQKIDLTLKAGIICDHNNAEGETINSTSPKLTAIVNYSPNQQNYLNLFADLATSTPGVSQRTENVVQKNEFLYVTGNPLLKSYPHFA